MSLPPYLYRRKLTSRLGNATSISVWSTIEPGVAIMASSLACLRPLLRWICTKAQSLRPTPSHSSQPTSHSTRSAQNPKYPKSGTGSNDRPRRDTCRDIEACHNELIELRSYDGKKDGSTECILLSQKEALGTLSPSEMGRSLELDRTSTRTTLKTTDKVLLHDRYPLPRPLDAS
jgi:hypothetical protein